MLPKADDRDRQEHGHRHHCGYRDVACGGERTGQQFQLGDAVTVNVAGVNLDERKIDFELISHDEKKGTATIIPIRKDKENSNKPGKGKDRKRKDKRGKDKRHNDNRNRDK